jgi:hypothetical protein
VQRLERREGQHVRRNADAIDHGRQNEHGVL